MRRQFKNPSHTTSAGVAIDSGSPGADLDEHRDLLLNLIRRASGTQPPIEEWTQQAQGVIDTGPGQDLVGRRLNRNDGFGWGVERTASVVDGRGPQSVPA